MAVASIGGVVVDILNGKLPTLSEKLERYGRPGIDGYGGRPLGLRARERTLELTAWTLTPNSLIADLKELEGLLVDITTSSGESDSGFDVDIEESNPQAVFHAGVNTFIVEAIVTVGIPA